MSTLAIVHEDPLGATLHKDGTTTFPVWVPFVDSVAVKINDGPLVPLTKEPGHPDLADTTWTGTVSHTKAGDEYRYAIRIGSITREFNDPRAQQLTGYELSNGFGLPGNSDNPKSVIVASADPLNIKPTCSRGSGWNCQPASNLQICSEDFTTPALQAKT
jgi:hypothetical protein